MGSVITFLRFGEVWFWKKHSLELFAAKMTSCAKERFSQISIQVSQF